MATSTTTDTDPGKADREAVDAEFARVAKTRDDEDRAAAFGPDFYAALKNVTKAQAPVPAEKPAKRASEFESEAPAEAPAEADEAEADELEEGTPEKEEEPEEELEDLPTEDPDWWARLATSDEGIAAIQVLRRNEWEFDELKGLASAEHLLAKAAKVAAKQANVDRLLNERGAPKKEADAPNEGDAKQPALPPVDFAALARPIRDAIESENDGDFAKAIQALIEASQAPIINAVLGLFRNQEEEWIEAARSKRSELAPEDVFGAVISEARERFQSKRLYPGLRGRKRWEAAIDDSMRLVVRDLPSDGDKVREKKEAKLRKNGRLSPPVKRVAAPELDEATRMKRVFDAAREGVIAPDEIQRRFHKVVNIK